MSIDQALLKLIEIVETAAPEVWRIAMLQVKAAIVVHWVWFGILMVLGVTGIVVVVTKHIQRYKEAEESGGYDRYEGEWLLALIAFIPMIIISLALMTIAIKMTVNPEFYAIEVILSLMP